jgi:hypothetical protein
MEKKIRFVKQESPLSLKINDSFKAKGATTYSTAFQSLRALRGREVANNNNFFKLSQKEYKFSNILSKNILMLSSPKGTIGYNYLKSTLSTILKKKIRSISEVLKDKPIKKYVIFSYLKNCIFSPTHLNGGRTKLSLNKYKGRKFGSFLNNNKIINYNFNSSFNPAN